MTARTATFEVTADYRPRSDKSPRYYFRTDKGKGWVERFFGAAYPWLKIYGIRQLREDELTASARERAIDI